MSESSLIVDGIGHPSVKKLHSHLQGKRIRKDAANRMFRQLATQQRQPAWVRLDGDRMFMAPFAMPISATGVANISNVAGRVVNADGGVVRRIEGTLRLSGPSVDTSGISFSIDAMP